jgi:lipopolysaccharide export system protein LptA
MRYLAFLLAFFAATTVRSQVTVMTPNDTSDIVLIKHADRLRYEKKDSATELQMLAGHVFLQQNNTLFYCDSAIIDRKTGVVEAFGKVHINDADSIHTYSDYLIYYSDSHKAFLKKNVKLTDGKGELTTNDLEYDTDTKIGIYTNGGKVVRDKTVLTSQEATYYGDMKDVYFKRNVKMRDPQYDLDTDSLLYNTDTQIATFITSTLIKADSGRRIVTTSEGYYDLKNKVARFGKRPVIKDGTTVVIGDDVGFDDVTGESYARGNAVFRDTAQGISILANDLKASKKSNTIQATQHPLMIIQQEKDSIYVTADTLYSARLTDLKGFEKTFLPGDNAGTGSDSLRRDSVVQPIVIDASDTTNRNRYIQAYHHVRIFSDSLQAVCDSLFYSGVDSVFRLFNNPIAWANGSQVTGDTLYLYTLNKKPKRIQVFDNAMVVNKTPEDYFNQMKGNTINGFFIDGAMDYLRARGSAESIYYAQDEDSAYSGVNRSTADIIDMYFNKQELSRVVFRSDVNGTMSPFRQVNHAEMRLRGFIWQDKRRPKTKFELFEDLPPAE